MINKNDMNDINFDIAKHWLPVSEKQGSIEKDTLRIKVSGVNFHTKPEADSWGVFTGCIKPEPSNPYDSNAIGFYKSDGQLLGYVQKELQGYVNQFTKGRELDCIISVAPFVPKDKKVCNQAYATILKFFEDDIEYATEMINRVTEDVGHDTLVEMTHFENVLPSLDISHTKVEDIEEKDEVSNTIFRYDEFYKFPQSDKTGKKSYDTLTVRIEDADWYFSRKKWQAGVFSGYVDVVHLESLNKYGIFREDNTLVGCPDSFDFDDEIHEFSEGHRIYCIFQLVPHIDRDTSCIDIAGKAVLIKFFENEKNYAHKLFEDTRTRLVKNAIAGYKRFTDKKEELELCDIKVMLSWSFDTRRYTFGDNGTTYLDDNGKPQKPKSGCATPIATLVLCLSLCCLLYLVAVIG